MFPKITKELREAVQKILRETSQDEMIENRRKLATRSQYGSRVKRMIRFIKNNFPEITDLIDEDNWLKRHVPTILMKELIAEFNERGIEP